MYPNRPNTQYLIKGPPGVQLTQSPPGPAHTLTLQYQESSFDVLPCTLDLPTGTLPPKVVRSHLAFYALFSDRVIIPDGWVHCKGPLSEYLRGIYRKAMRQCPSFPRCAEVVADDLFLDLLRKGIIVLALRGERPQTMAAEWRGFDFYGVWHGRYHVKGNKDSYGVYYPNAADRMMILDPTASDDYKVTECEAQENHDLVKMVGAVNSVFLDWASPWIPADTVHDSSADIGRWDRELSTRAFGLLKNLPIDFFSDRFLVRLSNALKGPEVRLSWEKLCSELTSLEKDQRFRRGSVEKVVGHYLFDRDHRLRSYNEIRRRLRTRSVWSYAEVDLNTLRSRFNLAQGVLRKVSTVQQLMFALKYRAIPIMPMGWSPDAVNAGLLTDLGINRGLFGFAQNLATAIGGGSLPLGTLTSGQISVLRESEERCRLFEALRKAEPVDDFWLANPDARNRFVEYVDRIAAAVNHSLIVKAAAAGTGTIVRTAAMAGVPHSNHIHATWKVNLTINLLGAAIAAVISSRPEVAGLVRQAVEGYYADHLLGRFRVPTPPVTLLQLNP